VASLRKIGELAVVHPAVQVSLGEGDKGKLPALHEVKDGDGRQDMTADVVSLPS
jgi:hypothetical protein